VVKIQRAPTPERFVYFHPAFPEHSARLDPLRNFNRSSEVASRIATVIPGESASDPFKAFGQKSLDNIVQGLFALEQRPTLMKLRRSLEGGPGVLVANALERYGDQVLEPGWRNRAGLKGKDTESRAAALVRFYRESLQASHPNLDLEGLISMFEHDRAHFGKMVASLLPIMNMLTSGTLGPLLSPDPSDVDDKRPITDSARIIHNAQVAYLGLDSLSDGLVGNAIGSILLADLASVAGDRYNYGVDNRPVNIFIDEAAEVINDPCIQLLNKGRGAKFRLFIATQTFADFSARTGSEAKARQILGNVNNLIALRVMDAENPGLYHRQPAENPAEIHHAHPGRLTHSANPAVFSGNIGERLMEEEGDLFAPQLLGQLPICITSSSCRRAHRQGSTAGVALAPAQGNRPQPGQAEGSTVRKKDALEAWRSRHVRESRILAVLEIDWPGTQAVCRNAIDYVAQHVKDP